jgi:DNA-binding CsgD family transcriptional regulator
VWYWVTRAASEGARWLDELLAPGVPVVAVMAEVPVVSGVGATAALAWGHFMRGFLGVLQADPAAARPALERSVTLAREVGQKSLLAHALAMASVAENMVGERAAARRLLGEAQMVAGGLEGDVPAALMLLQARALTGFFEGDLEGVRAAASEGVRLSREVGDLYALEMALMNVGLAGLIAGDHEEAGAPLAGALRIAQQIDDRVAQSMLLGALGYRAASLREPRLAAQLIGAAETIRVGAGLSVNGILAPLLARAEDAAKAALGATRFEGEVTVGRRLSRGAAVALALGETSQVAALEADDPRANVLATREAEVARLVADGLSNKQMGARLFISERTVDSHVRSILNKLGCNTRVQIAAWVTANQSPV